MDLAAFFSSLNSWIEAHQFLVISVVVPIISAFIAWRGVVGSNRSLANSLDFQREQSALEKRVSSFKEARDALSALSRSLVQALIDAQNLGPSPVEAQVNALKSRIDQLQIDLFQSVFLFSQLVTETGPLLDAFRADLQVIRGVVNNHSGPMNEIDATSVGFPVAAIAVLSKAGKDIEGIHL